MADRVMKFDVDKLKDLSSWKKFMAEKGGYYPVGPVAIHIPDEFHQYIPNRILKGYLADNFEQAHELENQLFSEDIPVFTKKFTTTISEHITENVTHIGRKAIEMIHPWVLSILVDWCDFDKIICATPLTAGFSDTHDTQVGTLLQDASQSTDTPGKVESVSAEHFGVVHAPDASTSDPPMPDASLPDIDVNNNNTWKRSSVLLLIKLQTEKEPLFTKVGVKKKSVWESIADEMKLSGFQFNYRQVEQKWKNLTKSYRDTVDHNSRSGNDRNECPYFAELESVYGYRQNVKP